MAGVGYTAGSSAFNTGNFYITLKPRAQRTASADQIIARLRPKLAAVEGANLYLQVPQDIKVGGRLGRTQYQYTLQDADLDELDVWAPKLVAKLQGAEAARRRHQRPAGERRHRDRDHRSRPGGTLRHPADADRRDDLRRHRPARGGAVFHPAQRLSRRPGGRPGAADRSAPVRQALSHLAAHAGQQVPVSTFVRVDMTKTAYLAINHQSQFPSVTVSFNLAGGAALGDAVTAVQQAETELGVPATLTGSFQGTAQAFQSSLATTPYLIAAALLVVYLILGVLYESFIHPLTILSTLPSAGVGALLMLMLFGYDLSVIAIIGIIMLIGIVKKNGIMMVDFALTRPARAEPAAGGSDLPGLRVALPSDHDDDDVRDPRRPAADAGGRHRLRAPPAARLCHGGRPAAEPGPDPVHHAGGLSLPRSVEQLAQAAGSCRGGVRRRDVATRPGFLGIPAG